MDSTEDSGHGPVVAVAFVMRPSTLPVRTPVTERSAERFISVLIYSRPLPVASEPALRVVLLFEDTSALSVLVPVLLTMNLLNMVVPVPLNVIGASA